MKKNEKGFSVVEILIIVVIVGLLGAVGWLVYDRQKSKTDNSSTTPQTSQQKTTTTAKTATPDPYSGWATCSDQIIGASVKYPSDWQNNVSNPTNSDGNPCGKYANSSTQLVFEVKSPKSDGKLFRIWYMPGNQYNKESLSDLNKVISVDPITTASGKSLSLVGYADQYNEDQNALSGIVLTDQHLTMGQTYRGYPTITAANGKQFALTATLTQDDGGSAESYVMSIYKQQPSYDDVLKVLKSVTY